jgi:glutamyl-tRNA synthetase
VRTDGTPTYNFCVVVDDVTMAITHVIRGNDHLSNTPKQILCYEALGYAVPQFAHVAMILGTDRSRLSKRHGATSVQAFRDMGIPSDAMVNYLARLGWSHGDQEIFSRAELIDLFDIKDVGSSGAVFDGAKLEWLSQHYIKTAEGVALAPLVTPFLRRAGLPVPDDPAWLGRVLDTLKERAKTLVELAEKSRLYFERPATYEPRAAEKFLTPEGAVRLRHVVARLEGLAEFTAPALETAYRELAAALELKLVDLAQLSRVAVTGTTVSPPIFEVLALLGRDESLARLRAARSFAERRASAAAEPRA